MYVIIYITLQFYPGVYLNCRSFLSFLESFLTIWFKIDFKASYFFHKISGTSSENTRNRSKYTTFDSRYDGFWIAESMKWKHSQKKIG